MMDPKVFEEFMGAAYRGAERVLDGLVDAYRQSHPELGDRVTRSVIAMAMVSSGLGELQRERFTLAEVQRKVEEAWDANEARERSEGDG